MNWEETKKVLQEKEFGQKKKSKIDDNPTSINTVNEIPFSEWVTLHTEEEIITLLLSLGNRRDLSIFD